MIYTFANNATGLLQDTIMPADTQIVLQPGQGALFPSLTPGYVFTMTLSAGVGSLVTEIVLVTATSGDVFTVVRGQEGTIAQEWQLGSLAQALVTAGMLSAMAQIASPVFFSIPFRIVQTDSDAVITAADVGLAVNKTSPTTFNLPAPTQDRSLVFMDYAGNAGTYPITLNAGSFTINNQQTLTIDGNNGGAWLIGFPAKWKLLST